MGYVTAGIIIEFLITKRLKFYYKTQQLLYYKKIQNVMTKRGSYVITKRVGFFTKCSRY